EYFLSVFQSCQVRPNVVERTSDMSVVRSLVANGYGFSLVNMRTKSEFAPDGERIAFLKLSDDIQPVVLGLVTKQVDYRSRIVEAFYQHAKAQFSSNGLRGIEMPT
ncbi:MAG: LysR substrate-binding domain-containing protein, partial [Pseudomonadota bacterium]